MKAGETGMLDCQGCNDELWCGKNHGREVRMRDFAPEGLGLEVEFVDRKTVDDPYLFCPRGRVISSLPAPGADPSCPGGSPA